MSRVPANLRLALLAVTAFWLATVGTGVSVVHTHEEGPGAAAPHRHLILFGAECPAETLEDSDGLGAWHAPVEPPADFDVAGEGGRIAVARPSPAELPTPHAHVADDWPPGPTGPTTSFRATRTAILRA